MKLEYRKLTKSELDDQSKNIPMWKFNNDTISRKFEFHTYLEGPLFALKIAHIAEDLDHHPEIIIGYKSVAVVVNTHAVDGLSPFDIELAMRIDAIALN